MKNRVSSRFLRMPLRRRLMVFGMLACSLHAQAIAKPQKPDLRISPAAAAAAIEYGKSKGKPKAKTYKATGKASWYGSDFHGRRTANGESFNRHEFTGAHRTLPFGTVVKVTNLRNGRSALVRINDRGPFTGNRIIDLSYAAARHIGITRSGVARVKIEEVAPARYAREDHARKSKG